jgi:glycosyltransferase involved in cell wall biosynthesis
VSDVGGARELVRDGVNGFLAGSPFADQIDDALERMWQARDILSSIGSRAYEDASKYLPSNTGHQFLNQLLKSLR